jgi:hypothetical protein
MTDEARQSGKPDLLVTLKAGAAAPAAGAEIAVTGLFVAYRPDPFQFQMNQAETGPK